MSTMKLELDADRWRTLCEEFTRLDTRAPGGPPMADEDILHTIIRVLRSEARATAVEAERDHLRERIAVVEQRRMEALADMEMAQNERHAMLIERDEALGLAACRMRPAMGDFQRETVVILLDGLEAEAGKADREGDTAMVRAIRATLGLPAEKKA